MSKPRGRSASHPKSIARSASRDPSRTLSPSKAGHGLTAEQRIGTSGWHYKSWIGPFYLPDVKPKDFLSFYVEHFNTTEINNSFYRLPTERAVKAWRESAPRGFLFAWKASRFITHLKRLKDVEDSIRLIFGRMAGLGPAFGPVLFQLPPTFRAESENLQRLARCLKHIPAHRRCVVEFRHPSWYEEPALDLLRDHNTALCISDHEAAPAPWVATADFVYIRAHGTAGRYAGHYSPNTLQSWAKKLDHWRRERRDTYVYFDNDVKSAVPQDAQKLKAIVAA
ncbi:DUF72 domain-containing protein [Microvirga puerhi]|uniref:DUF72 domain-containing protein n=1 Tax=Microvirga puerhi TaxID=2876078 RepID=A0ABS7VUF7_9HYPH|nr:DUF72 domain-containing protein [Microvirga puerhi]MBZ6079196.1 DUF72 domain-containing protein [Microvirga puerhi]